jgi:hypothetical protein
MPPPDFQPRRSSRLQKKGTGAPAATARQVRVSLITQLGLAREGEASSQEALQEYARLFRRPLSLHHLTALAEAFGWTLPEEVGAAASQQAILTGPEAGEA